LSSGSKKAVVETTAAKKSKVILPSAAPLHKAPGSKSHKRAQDEVGFVLVPDSLKRQKGQDKGKSVEAPRSPGAIETVTLERLSRLWDHPHPHEIAKYLDSVIPATDKARVDRDPYDRSCRALLCFSRVSVLDFSLSVFFLSSFLSRLSLTDFSGLSFQFMAYVMPTLLEESSSPNSNIHAYKKKCAEQLHELDRGGQVAASRARQRNPISRVDIQHRDCELLSMMDASQGYHQIPLCPKDQSKVSFVTNKGTYCYVVMPFELKNAGATYQRLMDRMFKSQIGRNIEVYMDDI
ncbi:Unknown protein, partial [Striga hermonthica]